MDFAKWFLPPTGETLTAEALDLLKGYATGDVRFLVPDLFWAEFGNALWKAARLKRLSTHSGADALRATRGRDFPTVSSHDLLEAAFTIASTFGRTVYDALYVALAVHSHSQLVTADERLANALAAHLPVEWLGAL